MISRSFQARPRHLSFAFVIPALVVIALGLLSVDVAWGGGKTSENLWWEADNYFYSAYGTSLTLAVPSLSAPDTIDAQITWNNTGVTLNSVTTYSGDTSPGMPLAGGNATWSATPGTANWIPDSGGTNWSTGTDAFPGATSGLTNGDTATFTGSSTQLTIAINSTSLNIKNITFSGGSEPAYTIGSAGGNSLLLTSAGTISIASNVTGASITNAVNAPLVLEPGSSTTSGSYTFQSSSGTASHILVIGGTVSGGTTTQGISLTLTGANTGANTVSGIVSDGGAANGLAITKASSGTWTLSGANTYTGTTTINAGILNIQNSSALGSATGTAGTGTTVASGATLQLQGGISVGNEALTISGTGVIGQNGALVNVSGNNTYGGAVTLSANSSISSDTANNTLTLSGAINFGFNVATFTGAGNITASGVISGSFSGNLIKNGTGTLTLSGTSANTYGGTTTVNAGELDLNKTAGVNATGNLNFFIGDGTGTDTAKLLAADQIADGVVVQIDGTSGVLNLNGNNETIAGLADRAGGTGTSGSVQLGAGTLTLSLSSGGVSFSGVISGSGSLVKTGNGTQSLSGSNTYTGGTNINGGTLALFSSGALGSSGTISFGGGTLQYSASNTNDYSGRFSTASNQQFKVDTNGQNVTWFSGLSSSGGTLSKLGSGTLSLTAANSYTGDTQVFGGTLDIENILALQNSTLNYDGQGGTVIFAVGAATFGGLKGGQNLALGFFGLALTVGNNNQSTTYSGVLSGNGSSLTKIGTGTLTLSGASTYTDGTTLNSGVLQLGSSSTGSVTNGPVGTGTLTLNGGTLSSDVGDFITVRSIANAITFGGDVTFGTATNFGQLALSGAGTLTGNRTLTFVADVTYSGNIGESGGSFGITKNGSGTLKLSGFNTYSGGTTVNDGLLWLNSTGALGSSSGSLTVNGGIVDLGGNSISVGNLNGSGGTIRNNLNAPNTTATLTIGTGNTGGGNYQGSITDNTGASNGILALTKTGTGTITLSGANTYSGGTAVNGGTLLVNNTTGSGTGTGAVSVNNTGTLGGTGTISGTVTVNSAGTIRGGSGATASGSLTVNNTLTLNSNSVIELALGPSGTHSTLALGGSVSFQVTQQFNFIDLGAQTTTYSGIITGVTTPAITGGWTIDNPGWSGVFSYNIGTQSIDLTLVAIPEPSTWAAASLTFVGLLLHQRRRLKKLIRKS